MTVSSPFGSPFSRAEGSRGASTGRGFSFVATRAGGNRTAGKGLPGAPSPGTNSANLPR